MSDPTIEAPQEKGFAAYLPIVISCIIFAFVPVAMQASCMGSFFPSLSKDYGVPTSSITIYLTVGGLLMAAWGPILGKLLAKYDVRVISTILVCVVAACFLSFSFGSSIVQVWITGACLVLGSLSLLALTIPTLINRWFKDKAGTMLGLVAAFTGVGGVAFIAVGNAIMTAADYRTAFLVYAIIVLVCCLPCTLFIVRSHPQDRGMLPYVSSKSVEQGSDASAAVAKKDWTIKVQSAWRSPAFYCVCICGALANMVVLSAQFFPTYVNSLQTAGIAVIITGATLSAIVSAGQAICKFLVGAASDFSPVKTITVASLIGIVGVLFIWFGPTTAMMPIGGFVFGFFYASVSVLMPILGGAVFGTGKNYPIVYGRSMLITNLLASPAGFMWPWISETFGGFAAVFGTSIVFILIFLALALIGIKTGKNIEREEIAG